MSINRAVDLEAWSSDDEASPVLKWADLSDSDDGYPDLGSDYSFSAAEIHDEGQLGEVSSELDGDLTTSGGGESVALLSESSTSYTSSSVVDGEGEVLRLEAPFAIEVGRLRKPLDDRLEIPVSTRYRLNRQINDRVLAARLPPELLCRIFAYCVPTTLAHPRSKSRRDACWIGFSQVCRRWRAVALADPWLWTVLDLSGQSIWTETMMARSRSLPLYLRTPVPPHVVALPTLLMILGKSMSQIRELDIAVPDQFVPVLSAPLGFAPHLVSLKIRHMRYQPYLQHWITARRRPHLMLSEDAFQGCSPLLKAVQLSHCGLHWRSAWLSRGITSLRVIDSTSISPTSPIDILEALRELPLLEFLELRNNIRIRDRPTARSRIDAIHFPHLTELILHDRPALAIYFLDGTVSLPPDIKVSITIDESEGSDPRATAQIEPLLETFLQSRYPADSIAALKVSLKRQEGVHRLLLRSYATNLPSPLLCLTVSEAVSALPRFLSIAGASTWSQGVKQVRIDGNGFQSNENLMPMLTSLGAFTSVRKLVLAPMAGYDVVRCLGDESVLGIFPLLRTLVLSYMVLEYPLINSAAIDQLQVGLLYYAKSRRGIGLGLETLRLSECTRLGDEIAEKIKRQTDVVVEREPEVDDHGID